jgi:glutathione S-transferase
VAALRLVRLPYVLISDFSSLLLCPHPGLPKFLEVTEKDGSKWTLAQGHSIVRYILKSAGHGGADAREEALIDSLCERAMDFRARLGAAVPYTLGAEEKKVKGQEWADANWATFGGNLDSFLAKSGSNFLVGSKLSAADVLFYAYIGALQSTGVKLALSEAQSKFLANIDGLENIKKFHAASYDVNPANQPK